MVVQLLACGKRRSIFGIKDNLKHKILYEKMYSFNSFGTLLVSASLDKTLKIWDMQGNCLKTLAEHGRYVNTFAINTESSIIASGSNDRTVMIWDLTGKFSIDSNLVDAKSALFNMAFQRTDIPMEYICPITHELMRIPVLLEGI